MGDVIQKIIVFISDGVKNLLVIYNDGVVKIIKILSDTVSFRRSTRPDTQGVSGRRHGSQLVDIRRKIRENTRGVTPKVPVQEIQLTPEQLQALYKAQKEQQWAKQYASKAAEFESADRAKNAEKKKQEIPLEIAAEQERVRNTILERRKEAQMVSTEAGKYNNNDKPGEFANVKKYREDKLQMTRDKYKPKVVRVPAGEAAKGLRKSESYAESAKSSAEVGSYKEKAS